MVLLRTSDFDLRSRFSNIAPMPSSVEFSARTVVFCGSFFVVAYAVAAAYSLLVLAVPAGSALSRLALTTDVVLGMVLAGAVASAGAISDIAKNGNSHAGWLPVCGQIHAYCNHVMAALIAGFVALAVHFVVVMYSLHIVTDVICPCH